MTRAAALLALGLWSGLALLFSEVRWFSRRPLADRVRPHVPGGWLRPPRAGLLSASTFRELLAPLAAAIGGGLARSLGIREELSRRLRRIHSPLTAAAFRLRQLTAAVISLVGTALVAIALSMPGPLALLALVSAPLLAFLLLEQQLSETSTRRQQRLFMELPIVSEQIGMLLSAGYSLGSALDRIAARGTGACAEDLRVVQQRVRHGLDERDALQEWADLAEVPGVTRLVRVLALDRETGDLGRLISEEARTLRRQAQRDLAALIDRRSQQVWVPVTVATLVPGSLFLAVPFLQAMRLFSN